MAEILLLENPRRKRSRRKPRFKKGSKAAKAFMRKLRLMKGPGRLNPKRRKKINSNLSFNTTRLAMARKHRSHRRRYRHNPPLKNIIGGVGSSLKTALFGAGGIAVNKLISNNLAPVLKLDPKNKTLLELASAMFLLPVVAKMVAKMVKEPGVTMAANVAASVAIFDAAKGYLPATVQSQLAGYNTRYQITDTPNYLPVTTSDSLPMPLY